MNIPKQRMARHYSGHISGANEHVYARVTSRTVISLKIGSSSLVTINVITFELVEYAICDMSELDG